MFDRDMVSRGAPSQTLPLSAFVATSGKWAEGEGGVGVECWLRRLNRKATLFQPELMFHGRDGLGIAIEGPFNKGDAILLIDEKHG